MKTHMMGMKSLPQIWGHLSRMSVFGVLLYASANTAIAGSAADTINFKAMFVGGSCSVETSTAQVTFNNGEAILSQEIISAPPETKLDLILSGCSGWGLTPKITITGESTSGYGDALFRDNATSTSVGYGVLLQFEGNEVFAANRNLAQKKSLETRSWNRDTELSNLNSTLPLTATLTCSNCNYPGRQGGDLNATVTFNFLYE